MLVSTVEFIYDADCPNVSKTREALLKAFLSIKQTPKWTEWDRNSDESPGHVRGYGSPTILVNGSDLVGLKPTKDANSCRVYQNSSSESKGVPSVELIVNALKNEGGSTRAAGLLGGLSIGPGLGAAFLAKASCPFCYPAIGGFLSSVGMGFLFEGPYFLLLMGLFLSLALVGLAFKAKTRRGLGPFWLGLGAVAVSFAGRLLANESVFYSGIVFLIIASIWNLWPKRQAIHCQKCES